MQKGFISYFIQNPCALTPQHNLMLFSRAVNVVFIHSFFVSLLFMGQMFSQLNLSQILIAEHYIQSHSSKWHTWKIRSHIV